MITFKVKDLLSKIRRVAVVSDSFLQMLQAENCNGIHVILFLNIITFDNLFLIGINGKECVSLERIYTSAEFQSKLSSLGQ